MNSSFASRLTLSPGGTAGQRPTAPSGGRFARRPRTVAALSSYQGGATC
ncbi:hypothetical protein FHS89_000075 [Rubricella aquisinus]|uniref:Uncharacterized protein n=1 Tax=Rubricella aquisinus TaxID=2028108 RepID=A0A840X092_9RHOB|nr:hypothetical protein [Rubricella aquisinus]